ncbi:MAG: endosialidase [Epulopiscium sp.]|nr:endosialidase [Candidatus Epulonipiscium sp.]
MAVIEELIREEEDQTISFGNYLMETKKKVLDFEVNGHLYKIKTFCEITKLEKNSILLFESVPGTTVHHFYMDNKMVTFTIEGEKDSQITLELEADKEYKIYLDQVLVGKVYPKHSGKVTFSVNLEDKKTQEVKIEKIS